MPIRFRCPHCERLLGIARRKSGSQIRCPQCGEGISVPHEDDGSDRTLRGLDDLLGPPPEANGTPAPLPAPEPSRPAVATEPFPRSGSRPSAPKRRPAGDDPLFEMGSVDALLGIVRHDEALELEEPLTVKPVSGMDAMSLDEGSGKIVLTSQKATMLVIAAAVLMLLAFAAGFAIGSIV